MTGEILPGYRRYQQLVVVGTHEENSRHSAEFIIARARRNQASGVPHNQGLATGGTPQDTYGLVEAEIIDTRFQWDEHDLFWQLDEYDCLAGAHDNRYRKEQSGLLQRWKVNPSQLRIPPVMIDHPDDYAAQCRRFDEDQIRAGNVHTGLFGVGTHGHPAFCESFPTTATAMLHFAAAGTGREILADTTKQDNGPYFDNEPVPDFASSQRPGNFLRNEWNIVMVNDKPVKADAAFHGTEGPVCGEWPISILQLHERTIWFIATEAAAKLTGKVKPVKWPGASAILNAGSFASFLAG